MEIKKKPQADLENKKTTFFLLGMIVALSTLFVLLEWKTEESEDLEWAGLPSVFIEEEFIEINENEQPTIQNAELEIIKQEEPTPVYEDYNIVDEVDSSLEEMFTSDSINQSNIVSEIDSEPSSQEKEDETVYSNPDIQPEFPGGMAALTKFIFSNTVYPASASVQKKQGRVWCSFIVNKDGSLSDIKIERGVFISLDQEAVRVLKKMPHWKPGSKNGETVRVKVYIPIVFQL